MLIKRILTILALPLLLNPPASIYAQEGHNVFRVEDVSAAKLFSMHNNSQRDPFEESSPNASPLSSDTNGWTFVATFDGNRISDEEWIIARDNMNIGLKIIIDDQNVMFFGADDLRNARCISISEVDSLRDSNNLNGMAFFHDEPDCNDAGLDYTYLFYTYDNNHYWNFSGFPVSYTDTWSEYGSSLNLSGKSIYIK